MLTFILLLPLRPWRHSDPSDPLAPVSVCPIHQNATYGDIQQLLKSQSLGADSEALCIAASSTGNVLAVGGRHGTVQVGAIGLRCRGCAVLATPTY